MRKLARRIFLKPVLWVVKRFSSRPEREKIFPALDNLYKSLKEHPGKKGPLIQFNCNEDQIIIFSDQHKGARNGADDFTMAEPNYLAALEYYNKNEYLLICLGDNEELWENSLSQVKQHNERNFEAERLFVDRNAFVKVVGNHDLFWRNDPLAWWQLEKIYGKKISVHEGLVLSCEIEGQPFDLLCTHGHQGDAQSDGNWFSKFFISRIWGPLQSYLLINPNTPAYDTEKKNLHNEIMYEWSATRKNAILITGHTHQPVFASLTHIERLYRDLQFARADQDEKLVMEISAEIRKREIEATAVSVDYLLMRPTYFNTGCCCFMDGDITGIELSKGCIRLIKWHLVDERPQRTILEEMKLSTVAAHAANP